MMILISGVTPQSCVRGIWPFKDSQEMMAHVKFYVAGTQASRPAVLYP